MTAVHAPTRKILAMRDDVLGMRLVEIAQKLEREAKKLEKLAAEKRHQAEHVLFAARKFGVAP